MFLRNILRFQQKQRIQELHTSFINSANLNADQSKYVGRQSSMLKKLMTGSNRQRKKYFNVEQTTPKVLEEIEFLDAKKSTKRSMSVKGKRRMNVLNTVFSEQITTLLSTGEAGEEVLGLGLQISNVQMALDFSKISVHWQPTGTETDDILEELLPRTARCLRHRLCETRVMGMIPPITFVKDKFYEKIVQVEKALETCDFGPDYVPTATSLRFKNMQNTPLSSLQKGPKLSVLDTVSQEVATEEAKSDKETSTEDNILQQSIDDIINGPEMRHDILGLNHARIMNKILVGVQQSQSKSEPLTCTPEESVDSASFDCNVVKLEKDRSREFVTNMRKKYYAKIKLEKRQDAALDTHLRQTEEMELLMAYQQSLKDPSSDHVEENDFICDDEDEIDDSRPPY